MQCSLSVVWMGHVISPSSFPRSDDLVSRSEQAHSQLITVGPYCEYELVRGKLSISCVRVPHTHTRDARHTGDVRHTGDARHTHTHTLVRGNLSMSWVRALHTHIPGKRETQR